MQQIINQFKSRQFILFLMTGGIAAVVNLGSRILYSQWLSFSLAVIFAYITGMVTAFILAKIFVFNQSTQPLGSSVIAFSLVNCIAIVQTWLISMGMAYYLLPALGIVHYVHEIAHFSGVIFPVFTSFIGHKRWSFR